MSSSWACRGLVISESRDYCLIVCPLPNSIVEECKNTSTAKLPAQTLPTRKSISPRKLHLKWELRSEKVVRVSYHVAQL